MGWMGCATGASGVAAVPRAWLAHCAATLLVLAASAAGARAAPAITDHQATTHLMRYHLALPSGWSRERAWPVVVVIPDAAREFA